VEETEFQENTTNLPQVTDKLYHKMALGLFGPSSKFILYLYTFIIFLNLKRPGGQKLTYAMQAN
jgi:hypothetical protein